MGKIEWERVTLSNVASGLLEQLFQRELPKVIKAFGDASRYECAGKQISYGVHCEVTFTKQLEAMTTTVHVRVVPKPPKAKTYTSYAQVGPEEITVQRATQQELEFEPSDDAELDPTERHEEVVQ